MQLIINAIITVLSLCFGQLEWWGEACSDKAETFLTTGGVQFSHSTVTGYVYTFIRV